MSYTLPTTLLEFQSSRNSKPKTNRFFYRYLLALGTNLGNHSHNFARALALLSKCPFHLVAMSPILSTAPLPRPQQKSSPQPQFSNMLLDGITPLSPQQFYYKIARIENRLGHNRKLKWDNRHLDIDILLVSVPVNQEFASGPKMSFRSVEGLKIPHYAITEREFIHTLLTTMHTTCTINLLQYVKESSFTSDGDPTREQWLTIATQSDQYRL